MLNLQPESGCSWYLIKLSGLPVEFGAVVLARNHQYGVGHIHRLLRGHLQVLPWAVPQSVLPGMGWGWVRTGRSLCLTLALPKGSGPAGGGGGSDSRGHEEWGTHRSVHSGLQVINPTDQEKACEGEEQSARWPVGPMNPDTSGPDPMQAPGGPDGASLGPRARGARPEEGAESERGMPCSQGSKPPAPFDSLSAVGSSGDSADPQAQWGRVEAAQPGCGPCGNL